MTPADRILRLVASGKVSREEGARLIAAMGPEPKRRPRWSLVVNPFDRFGGEVAAVGGLVVSLASLALTRGGVHFDGFMDMHYSRGHVAGVGASLLEQALGWLAPAVLFWAYARAFTPHVRLVDFVGFVGLARAPLLVVGTVALLFDPEMPPGEPRVTPALLAVGLVALPLLLWFLVLLYLGFKNATGFAAVSGKLIGGFVGLLLVSEVASKAVLLMSH